MSVSMFNCGDDVEILFDRGELHIFDSVLYYKIFDISVYDWA